MHRSSRPILSTQKKKLTEEEINDLHQELETVDHLIPLQKLCDKLKTNLNKGLTHNKAEEILLRDGLNALSPPKMTPECIKFLKCMYGGFAALLWVCAILCFILHAVSIVTDDHHGQGIEWFGVIIVVICIISGLFAYIQESKFNVIC